MPDDEEAEASDSSEYEVFKPPERREGSSRAGRGNRMTRLIAEEEDEEEEDADKEFYTQDFWKDEEEDNEFAADDADDEEGRDSFDSDFGESDDSDDDDDGDEEEGARKRPKKASSGKYKDPKLARKKGSASAGADGSSAAGTANQGAPKPASHRKRARTDPVAQEMPMMQMDRSRRSSTADASASAAEKRKILAADAKARAERLASQGGRKPGVEMVRLTQEQILAEAIETEIINRASLERQLRIQEDNRRVEVRERKVDGPRCIFRSRLNPAGGAVPLNTLTFIDTVLPAEVRSQAKPYPPAQKCAVTHHPARYRDPATGTPYATLEAFRQLRGRTGRRQHSFGGAGSAAAVAAAAASSGAADD